jgi:sodium/potassium/calcium exchanger 1
MKIIFTVCIAFNHFAGSNIFDVTVGLPVPWLLYTMINQTHMPVTSTGKTPHTPEQ